VALFGRKLPAEIREIARASRVLAYAQARQGFVVATPEGLWWPEEAPRLIAWSSISKASWRDDALTVIEADVIDDLLLVDRPPVSVALADSGALPVVVRERVERSIRSRDLVPVSGGAARLVARRVPGVDGVVWRARLEPGTPDTADVRNELRALVAIEHAASDAARADL
jgi:hypothetical protein